MRFYPRKAPRKKADILVDKIASGKCDDLTVNELRVAVAEVSDPEELQRISWAVLDIAMNTQNYVAAGYALKSILIFRPMAEDIENALDNRVLMLIENKAAVSCKPLVEAIAAYAKERASENIDRSAVFIPALLILLEEGTGTTATVSYEVLLSAAINRPEFFEHHSWLLVRELGSINNSTRVYTARIITKLATTHPEYVIEAEKTLLHTSTFYPDAEVKSAAAEAYQTITQNKAMAAPAQDVPAQPRHDSTGGLAEIMRKKASARDKNQATDSRIDNRLLSLAANFARKSNMRNGQASANGASQGSEGAQTHDADNEAMDKIIDDFSEIAGVITGNPDEEPAVKPAEEKISKEEAELRDMVAKVQLDFSESAESLLDSLGMKHMHKEQQGEAPETTGTESEPATTEAETQSSTEVLPTPEPVVEAAATTADAVATAGTIPVVDTVPTADAVDNSNAVQTLDIVEDTVSSVQPVETSDVEPDIVVLAPATENPADDHSGQITPAEVSVEIAPAAVPEVLPLPDPATPVKVEMAPAAVAAAEPVKMPEKQPEEPVARAPVEAMPEKVPESLPDAAEKENGSSASKVTKSPIIPAGVRMSAVKFKTLDQSKKQQPSSKVSIKPHIKPLNRTPRDISKMAQQQAAPTAAQQKEAAPASAKADTVADSTAGQQQKAGEVVPELTVCPTCNEKIVGDQQYCLKCGTDLKSLNIRCPRCSQINARETGTCVRCGARLMKGPAVAKQPDIL